MVLYLEDFDHPDVLHLHVVQSLQAKQMKKHYYLSMMINDVDKNFLVRQLLTCLLDGDSNSVDADIVHFFDSPGRCRAFLVLDERVPALERELSHGSKLLEFVLEIIRVNFTLQPSDVDLVISS